MDKFFEAIRENSSKLRWSQAVALSRKAELQIDKYNKDECSLLISEEKKPISSSVRLWFEDEDWSCDCTSKEDPCIHVITSAILLRNKKTLTDDAGKSKIIKSKVKISYDFFRVEGALVLKRYIVSGKKNILITSSLSSIATGRIIGPKLLPTRNDYAIESLIGTNFHSYVVKHSQVSTLFGYLTKVAQVRLEGKKVSLTTKQTGFIVCIKDESGGVNVYGKQDSAITEVFRNGIALCGKKLHPINTVKLNKDLLKLLAEGKYFGLKELPYVVSELIPDLSSKFPIEILSKKIPMPIKIKPRVEFFLRQATHKIDVLAKIVYGDPTIAVVENGQLVLKGKGVPVRDTEEEVNLQVRFHSHFSFHVGESSSFQDESAIDFVSRLKTWKKDLKKGSKLAAISEKFSVYQGLKPKINIDYVNNKTRFDVGFTLGIVDEEGVAILKEAKSQDVFDSWKKGSSLVPLIDGGWAHIPKEWLDKHMRRLSELLEASDHLKVLPKCLSHTLVDFVGELDDSIEIPEAVIKMSHSLKSFERPKSFALPSDLKASLRPYQIEGFYWLSFLKQNELGALLADDMGLGKTLQSICILNGKSLVIAPTSVLYNWENEINRFRPSLNINIYHGAGRKICSDSDNITLTTYSIARLDSEALSAVDWDNIILDEAQNIKNPESKIAQAVFGLSGSFKLALTGTPIENRLEDVWSLFYFLNRGLLGSRKDFNKNYIKVNEDCEQSDAMLRKKIQPFVLRRIKSEVAKELPSRTNVVLYNELDEEELATYQAIEAATKKDILEKLQIKNANIMKILEALLRLRQAACHIGMLPGQDRKTSSKINLLLSGLEKCLAGGHKALIFSQWTTFLDLIGNEMKKRSMKYLRIDGSTQKRQDIVKSFQTSDEHPFLLLSLKAAGIGLNLTAADHVFIMDPWWNPAVEEQAADRSYRIGQKKPVIVHKLVTKGSVEENIIKLQQKKKSMADAIIGKTGSHYQLTREDMMNLFQP